jgi:hypothetical protein
LRSFVSIAAAYAMPINVPAVVTIVSSNFTPTHRGNHAWHSCDVRERVMYVELKAGEGTAWIGRVQFSKTGRTVYYRGRKLERIRGGGISGNHIDTETGEEFWISGVKKNGQDRHWAEGGPVEVDADALDEYNRLMGN